MNFQSKMPTDKHFAFHSFLLDLQKWEQDSPECALILQSWLPCISIWTLVFCPQQLLTVLNVYMLRVHLKVSQRSLLASN